LTGVDVGKLLPIPDISNKRFPEAKKHEDSGLHRILYQFSPSDYTEFNQIWNGEHPEDGSELSVQPASNEGATPPDLDEEPQLTAPLGPDIDHQMFADVAAKLGDDVKRRSARKRAKTAASRPRR
jgi:manganese catalase